VPHDDPAIVGARRGLRLGWYSDLGSVERRTYWACFEGSALDSMDTTIYALVIPTLLPQKIGWRVFFALGIISALLIFFIHRLVPESGIYAEAKAARAAGENVAPLGDLHPTHPARTATALIMSTGIFGGGLGSVLPATVGVLATAIPLGIAMRVCTLTAYAVAFGAVIVLPDTKGLELRGATLGTAAATR
jgi:hypothetical protein